MKGNLLTIILFSFAILSCTKDNSEDQFSKFSQEEQIRGSWQGEMSNASVKVSGSGGFDTLVEHEQPIPYYWLHFYKDGRGQRDSLGHNMVPFTWEFIAENSLIFDSKDTFTIQTLSKTKLIFNYHGFDSFFGPSATEINADYHLKRSIWF